MRGSKLLLEIGSTILALPGGLVPAHLGADPPAAPGALVEMLLALLHRCRQRVGVSLTNWIIAIGVL